MVTLGFANADFGILSIVSQHPSQCAIGYASSVFWVWVFSEDVCFHFMFRMK